MKSLRDLAEYIADYLSEDAAHWPLVEGRGAGSGTVRVAFRWFGSFVPANGRALLSHLAGALGTPYRSADRPSAVALLYVDHPEQADAELVIAEVVQDGAPGFAYEIHFRSGGGPFPGWFRNPAG